MDQQSTTIERPWSVKALAIWTVVAIAQSLIQDVGLAQVVVAIGFGGLVAWAVWKGQPWLYTLLLFCALTQVLILILQVVFMDLETSRALMYGVVLVILLVLLMHPRTRDYVGQNVQRPVPSGPSQATEAQPLGVRRNTIVALVFLLIAIAIAGTLGVLRIYQMTG